MKVRHKLFKYVVNVTAVFNSEGEFLYCRDDDEAEKGNDIRYSLDELENINPIWVELETDIARETLQTILKFDQAANSPEDTAKMAMDYAASLVGEIRKRYEFYYGDKEEGDE